MLYLLYLLVVFLKKFYDIAILWFESQYLEYSIPSLPLPSLLVRIYSDTREIFYNWIKFQIFQRDQESNYFRKYLATVWKKG